MTRHCLAAFAAFSVLLATPALRAQTAPLPAGDIRCNVEQLTRLADRTRVIRPNGPSDKSIGVAYTFASPFGGFSGIAYTQQFFTDGRYGDTPEHHLWFSTNPHEVRLLRNPARSALPTLSLTRNTLNSDLVPADDPDRFEVLIDPTLANTGTGSGLLHLDNLAGDAGRSTSTKPGRGLATVVRSCHDRFTAADVHVFSLLAKTLRAYPFTPEGDSRDSVMIIYRGASSEPTGSGRSTTYRIDVLPLGRGAEERASFAFEVEIDGAGRLGSAHLAALPECGGAGTDCTAGGASAMLVFSRPVLPGAYWEMTPLTPSACTDDLLHVPGCEASLEIPLEDLLAESTWLRVR